MVASCCNSSLSACGRSKQQRAPPRPTRNPYPYSNPVAVIRHLSRRINEPLVSEKTTRDLLRRPTGRYPTVLTRIPNPFRRSLETFETATDHRCETEIRGGPTHRSDNGKVSGYRPHPSLVTDSVVRGPRARYIRAISWAFQSPAAQFLLCIGLADDLVFAPWGNCGGDRG